MEKTNCGVYKIVNLINGKLYIGSSINLRSRKNEHFWQLKNNKHANSYLQRSYNKYGIENFSWEIIEYLEYSENKEQLKIEILKREQYWIDTLVIKDGVKIGYNTCTIAGSCAGRKWSDEHKKRLSESHMGSKNPMYGRIVSEETRRKQSIKYLNS